MDRIDVAVVGAGPFGLSVAAHLDSSLHVRVSGKPMETWRERMPPQMVLRSAWEETSIAPNDAGSIDVWARERGELHEDPIPLEKFLRYADWFRKRLWPALDRGFRSTAGRLLFVGYPAEGTFGPLQRFVLGTDFTADRIARVLGRDSARASVLLAETPSEAEQRPQA